MQKFRHNVHFVIFTTDATTNQQFVLSTNKEEICLPYFSLDSETKKDIDEAVGDYMRKNILFLPNEELFAQLINLNEECLSDDPETVSSVYGFVVPKDVQRNIENCTWVEFSLVEPNKFSNLFIDTIRSLN